MRKNLKIFRIERDLTQAQIAEKIGCRRATYAAIEKGVREGRRAFWNDLQAAFNIDSDAMWDLMRND